MLGILDQFSSMACNFCFFSANFPKEGEWDQQMLFGGYEHELAVLHNISKLTLSS